MRDLKVSFPTPCGERWEIMSPAGRARVCARCDKAVHDLSQFELGEAEAMLRAKPGACVRARVDAQGLVQLKPGREGKAGRMAVAIAASAGLLAAGQPVLAKADRPGGAIAGSVDSFGLRVRVTATDADGRTFKAKTGRKGRYRIKHVPAGAYRLTFTPHCGDAWTVENVVVGEGETKVSETGDGSGCIIVGQLRVEESRG